MAMFPCDNQGHRYPGKQSTAYVAVLRQTAQSRRRLRLCALHYEGVASDRVFDGQAPTYEGEWQMHLLCAECGAVLEQSAAYAVFLTGYPAHDEREDKYGQVCEACQPTVAGRLGVPPL